MVDVVGCHEVQLDAVGVGGLRREEVAHGVAEVEDDDLKVVTEPGRDKHEMKRFGPRNRIKEGTLALSESVISLIRVPYL